MQTQLELIHDWWNEWHERDYSWEGLAAQEWAGVSIDPDGNPIDRRLAPDGSRDATLQDYWRGERDHLVRGDGKAWTRAHCPLEFADGTPAKSAWGKTERAELTRIVEEHLRRSSEAELENDRVSGPDFRAQFAGAVLLDFPLLEGGSPVTASFVRAAFCEDVRFPGRLGSGTHLQSCLFLGRASLDGIEWRGLASLQDSRFVSEVSFAGSRFLAGLRAIRIEFCRDVTFGDAHFKERTWITGCKFGRTAEFEGTVFDAKAEFNSSEFGSVNFDGAEFRAKAEFIESKFVGRSSFKSKFNATANFIDAVFGDLVSFNDAVFHSDAIFNRVKFLKSVNFTFVRFHEFASFGEADFGGIARFDLVSFELANFTGSRFANTVSCNHSSFFGDAKFVSCDYLGATYFNDSTFAASLNFYGSHFHRFLSFRKIRWPELAEKWHAAFDQALFSGVTTFSESGFGRMAAFSGAVFERSVALDDPGEGEAELVFRAECRAAVDLAESDYSRWLDYESCRNESDSSDRLSAWLKTETRRAFLDHRLGELERGCRVLKKAFAAVSDTQREQILYRFELRARRAQPRISAAERLMSHLYGLSADYGASVVRPLVGIGLTLLLFAAVFLAFALFLEAPGSPKEAADYLLANGWEAMTFSWNNSFKPLSALSLSDSSTAGASWEGRLIVENRGAARFLLIVLATLQSICSVALAFLFVLAVRRRFQIA